MQSPTGNNIKIKRIMGVGFFDVITDLCIKENNTCKFSMRQTRGTRMQNKWIYEDLVFHVSNMQHYKS